ncbi:MAG: hypothetical protein D6714_08495 [Bacteroidetes bacterium]|nr:MAG: hypothetical protein D6714_08495 [Bacteroidota bacterium]
MGLTYRDAGKFYGEQKGDLKKALEYLTKAYEILPDDYDTLRLLGVAYGIGGNHEKAIYFFEKAWQIQPENADAMFNLGTAYRLGGQIEKAAEWIAKAKAVNPKIEEERSQRK